MIETVPCDGIVTPAVQLFLDTLNWSGGFEHLAQRWLYAWAVPLLLVAMSLFALLAVLASRGIRPRRATFLALVCLCTYRGVTKIINIIQSSGSAGAVTLVEATAGDTNGYSRVIVKATGGDPAPMWYREAASNDWTLATDDGWTAHSLDHSGSMYTREWRNADTNEVTYRHQMWFFGEHPPAVELAATGGVTILSAAFTGQFVRFTWYIDPDITLQEGSTVHLQGICLDDSLPAWNDEVVDSSPDHETNTTTVTGFFLDRRTAWRFRLEVPR